jgi:hypothetical protein
MKDCSVVWFRDYSGCTSSCIIKPAQNSIILDTGFRRYGDWDRMFLNHREILHFVQDVIISPGSTLIQFLDTVFRR